MYKRKLFILVALVLSFLYIGVNIADARSPYAEQIKTDTTDFDGNLTADDDTVQKALETIDELTGLAGDSSPGGASGQLQYNNAGTLGGITTLVNSAGTVTYNGSELATVSAVTNSANWDTAYGWGDHSTEGYLTSESDPGVTTHESTYNHTNYNTAYTHSQLTTGNPHSISAADVGLSNVENTALSSWVGTANVTTLGTVTTGDVSAVETDPVYTAWDKDYDDLTNTPTIPSGNQIIDWTDATDNLVTTGTVSSAGAVFTGEGVMDLGNPAGFEISDTLTLEGELIIANGGVIKGDTTGTNYSVDLTGDLSVSGSMTASAYYTHDGSAIGGAGDKVYEDDTSIECVDTGTDGVITFKVDDTTILEIEEYLTVGGNNIILGGEDLYFSDADDNTIVHFNQAGSTVNSPLTCTGNAVVINNDDETLFITPLDLTDYITLDASAKTIGLDAEVTISSSLTVDNLWLADGTEISGSGTIANFDEIGDVDLMTEADDDLLFYDVDAWNRLAHGTDGQVLKYTTANGIEWGDASAGGATTSDGTQTYVTDTNDNFCIGGTTTSNSDVWVNTGQRAVYLGRFASCYDINTYMNFGTDLITMFADNKEYLRVYEPDGEIIINDTGLVDADLRVEGDTETNLLMTDASEDAVAFGGSDITADVFIDTIDDVCVMNADLSANGTITAGDTVTVKGNTIRINNPDTILYIEDNSGTTIGTFHKGDLTLSGCVWVEGTTKLD